MIVIVFLFFFGFYIKILGFVGIEITRVYSENLLEADSALFTLLNYNNCDEEIKLPVRELIGLSIVNKKDSFLVEYGGESNQINVRSCITKLLGRMYGDERKYNFNVKYPGSGGKNYLTITKLGDETYVSIFKIIPVPNENYNFAYVTLAVELPEKVEVDVKIGEDEDE